MPAPELVAVQRQARFEAQRVARAEARGLDARRAHRVPERRGVGRGDVQLDAVLAGVAGARRPRDRRPGATAKRGTAAASAFTVASSARASGPCTASTARVEVMSANSTALSVWATPSANAASSSSVFDAFGITKKRSSSTHHTMMSSTTCASSGSSRCVYCARPRSILRRSFVSNHCNRSNAPGPAALDRAQVRDVEHHRAGPARPVLVEHARVLQRHVPAAERHHARAERPVPRVERAVTQTRVVAHADSCGLGALGRGVGRDERGRRPRSSGTGARRDRERRVAPASASTSCDGGSRPYFTSRLQVVALVEHADRDVGMQLDEPARLAVLLRHELLVQRRDLDVEVVRGQVEVGSERLHRPAVAIGLQRERARLVLPGDAVEVEQLRELALGVVREPDELVREDFAVDDALPTSLSAAARVVAVGVGRTRVARPR